MPGRLARPGGVETEVTRTGPPRRWNRRTRATAGDDVWSNDGVDFLWGCGCADQVWTGEGCGVSVMSGTYEQSGSAVGELTGFQDD